MLLPQRADLLAVVLVGAALASVTLHHGLGLAALVAAGVTAPLVIADVRRRLLPDVLTLPVALAGTVEAIVRDGEGRDGATPALVTLLALTALSLTGALGRGDVKLGTGLALALAPLDPLAAVVAPVLAFALAGVWALPFALRGDRGRIAFGPFQLAAFWLVASAA